MKAPSPTAQRLSLRFDDKGLWALCAKQNGKNLNYCWEVWATVKHSGLADDALPLLF